MAKAEDVAIWADLAQLAEPTTGVAGTAHRIRGGKYSSEMETENALVEEDPAHEEFGLFCRLVELGRVDRERYRKIRALMWALYVENSGRSDKPSESS